MNGFAKIPDSVMRRMDGAGGNAWAMLVAIARQSHFADGWSCKQLDEHAGCASRTGRHARKELESRGIIERDGRQWKLTGNPLPVTTQKRQPIAGVDEGKAATHCRSERQPIAGTPYIERKRESKVGWHEGSAPLPRPKKEEVPKSKLAQVGALVRQTREALKAAGHDGTNFVGHYRKAMLHLIDSGADMQRIVADVVERIERGELASLDAPYAYLAKNVEQWALELPEAAPVVSLTDRRNKQTTRDAKRIRHALSTVPSDAPDEDAFRMVHAEAREEITRHGLKTLADVHAWLDSHQEVSHAA